MSKHNILCTICRDVLKSTDDICNTNCGHVFHNVCMNECKSQSICPECLHNNPTTHKMYLFFDESKDECLPNNWKDKKKIIELHKQIEENNSNYLHLQEKYVISQDCVRRLEGRIKKLDHSILQRSVILSDLEDRIKTLEELNQYLTIDNECKSEALALKSSEITKLKNSVAKLGKQKSSAPVLNDQHSILEKKLNDQLIQLDRETAKCSQLSREKEKLQNYIDLMKWEENDKVGVANNDISKETYSTKKRKTKVACGFNSLKPDDEATEDNITNVNTPDGSADTNSSPPIYVQDVVPSFIGYSILNGNPLNNYFSKLFINNQKTKNETLPTAKHQISSCSKLKLIFRKLRNKCLVRSTVLIFLVLMTNVRAVY